MYSIRSTDDYYPHLMKYISPISLDEILAALGEQLALAGSPVHAVVIRTRIPCVLRAPAFGPRAEASQ